MIKFEIFVDKHPLLIEASQCAYRKHKRPSLKPEMSLFTEPSGPCHEAFTPLEIVGARGQAAGIRTRLS